MLKFPRRRFSSASLRGAALASLLVASLIGFVGCSGGANPFCCDSKDKERLDQNLERAQSADEDADETDVAPSHDEENDETQESPKDTIVAGLAGKDGSGDAPALAASTAPAQQVPVTASAGAVSPNALESATPSSTPAPISDAPQDDANALLAAPPLTPNAQTSRLADAPDVENQTSASENVSEEPSEAAPVAVPPAASSADANAAPSSALSNDSDATEAQAALNTQDEPKKQEENTQTGQNTQEEQEKQKELDQADASKTVARAPWRNGPQRAASARVAQRATTRTLAVPETRGAATSPAAVSFVPFQSAPVVKVRAQANVPAVASNDASSRPETLPSLGAQASSNVVKIKKRAFIP